jgi:hypothetical protein
MSRTLRASFIAQDLFDYLATNEGCLAQVHSVFKHAVNLLADDGVLITLAAPTNAILPMGVVIEGVCDSGWPVRVGDRIRLDPEMLMLINKFPLINLQGAELWNPNPILSDQLRARHALEQVRSELVSWLALQPNIGLLPLLPKLIAHRNAAEIEIEDSYSRFIAADLSQFVDELNSLDWQAALKTARNLVGFGMGSTPSCDDFLAAFLVVLLIAQVLQPNRFAWVSELNHCIVTLANTRTTLISAQMLKHAASGKVSQSHQRLIHACLFDTDDDLSEHVKKVSQTGASSGMDFLLGLTCALEWFIVNVVNHPTEGGMEQVESQHVQPVTII